mmetsp:Transcript_73253/g.212154  ORF Transcript_73253/g.212154 Transcript_73253/m.212154 type:complete len:211 (+) Transcript_73253:577-1209(+)
MPAGMPKPLPLVVARSCSRWSLKMVAPAKTAPVSSRIPSIRNSSGSSLTTPGSEIAAAAFTADLKPRPRTPRPLAKLGSRLFLTNLGGLALAFGSTPESSNGLRRRSLSGDGSRGPNVLPSPSLLCPASSSFVSDACGCTSAWGTCGSLTASILQSLMSSCSATGAVASGCGDDGPRSAAVAAAARDGLLGRFRSEIVSSRSKGDGARDL